MRIFSLLYLVKAGDRITCKRIMNTKNKKGVSEIIGYILLVAIVVTISIFVYQWLKTYVPQDAISCPDGVSLSVISYNYSCASNTLNLTLQNTGTFNISGYFIHGSDSPNQQIATIDLTEYYSGDYTIANNAVYYFLLTEGNLNPSLNPFSPGEITGGSDNFFDLSKINPVIPITTLNSLEITPTRFVELNGRNVIAGCDNAKIDLPITCS